MLEAFISNPYGVIGAVLLACFVAYLTWRNGRKTREAKAAATFRTSVHNAFSAIPPAEAYWSIETTNIIASACITLNPAVSEFALFLPRRHRERFFQEWRKLRVHCEGELPNALSPAERLYGRGPSAVNAAKERFQSHVQSLLSFARQT